MDKHTIQTIDHIGEEVKIIFDSFDNAYQYMIPIIDKEIILRKQGGYGDLHTISLYRNIPGRFSRLLIHVQLNKFEMVKYNTPKKPRVRAGRAEG